MRSRRPAAAPPPGGAGREPRSLPLPSPRPPFPAGTPARARPRESEGPGLVIVLVPSPSCRTRPSSRLRLSLADAVPRPRPRRTTAPIRAVGCFILPRFLCRGRGSLHGSLETTELVLISSRKRKRETEPTTREEGLTRIRINPKKTVVNLSGHRAIPQAPKTTAPLSNSIRSRSASRARWPSGQRGEGEKPKKLRWSIVSARRSVKDRSNGNGFHSGSADCD